MVAVIVYWRDPRSYVGWTTYEDAKRMTPVECRTLGFIIKKGKKDLVIAQTDGDNEMSLNHVSIPLKLIDRIVNIDIGGN